MIKTYRLGPISLTIRKGESHYASCQTLDEPKGTDLRIVRQETRGLAKNESKYSLRRGDEELAFIRGSFNRSKNFHIGRVEKVTQTKTCGFSYLSRVYATMERDLKRRGIRSFTTLSLAKLAHIPVKRYGFYDIHGKSYEELKRSWLKVFPWKAVSLEKKL